MTIRRHAVFFLALTLLFGWRLTLAEPLRPVSNLQGILAQKKLVVALVDTDYPPLFVTSQTGQLEGSDISLVRDMAKELGVQVEFVRKTHSFNEIIDIVSRGEADIGLGTSISLSRAQKVRFSQPYLTLKIALFLNRLKLIEHGLASELKELADIRHTTQTIGVLTGSAYAIYARHHFPQATVKEYPSLPELIEAVQRGDLLAAVRNDLTATLYLHRNPEAILQMQLFVDQSTQDYVAFPVHRDRPHLLAWLNAYLLLKGVQWHSSDLVEQYKRRPPAD